MRKRARQIVKMDFFRSMEIIQRLTTTIPKVLTQEKYLNLSENTFCRVLNCTVSISFSPALQNLKMQQLWDHSRCENCILAASGAGRMN